MLKLSTLISAGFLLMIASCEPSLETERNTDFSSIKKELTGTLLRKKLEYSSKYIEDNGLNTLLFYKAKDSLITEIDIHFKSVEANTFKELLTLYNNQFNTSQSDTVYNTWQTDSAEFILYKNTDSSILVNIYKR